MFKKDDLTELIDVSKLKDLVSRVKKEEAVKEKKQISWKCVLGIIAAIVAIAGIAYGLYRYFKPDYEDEFMDDFDDDDTDLFEDDDEKEDEDEDEDGLDEEPFEDESDN